MVLWVDDDIDTSLRPYIDEIEFRGQNVLRARNPDQMWEILRSSIPLPEIIIMDIMLPTGEEIDPVKAKMGFITGLLLLQKLSEDERYAAVRTIIFSIVNDQNVSTWADQNGIPFLHKQETYPKDLANVVDRVLKERK